MCGLLKNKETPRAAIQNHESWLHLADATLGERSQQFSHVRLERRQHQSMVTETEERWPRVGTDMQRKWPVP